MPSIQGRKEEESDPDLIDAAFFSNGGGRTVDPGSSPHLNSLPPAPGWLAPGPPGAVEQAWEKGGEPPTEVREGRNGDPVARNGGSKRGDDEEAELFFPLPPGPRSPAVVPARNS